MKTFTQITSKLFVLLAAIAFLGFTSCDPEVEEITPEIKVVNDVKEILFTPEETMNQEIAFTSNVDWELVYEAEWLTINPMSGEAGDITIEIENPAEAEENRSVEVVIRSLDSKASVEFTVRQIAPTKPESIVVQADQRKILAEQKLQLSVVVLPEGAKLEGTPTWKSSESTIISVDDQGMVTGVAEGEATITATLGNFEAQFPMAVTEHFTTDGNNRTYTFADLARLPTSGIISEGSGAYAFSGMLELAATDVLTIGDAKSVTFADGAEWEIRGAVEFKASAVGDFVLDKVDTEAEPEPIYFTETGTGTFTSIHFDGVPLKHFSDAPLTVTKSKFTGVTSRDACVSLGGTVLATIEENEFIQNAYPALQGAGNRTSPLSFKNNILTNNSNGESTRNRPQVNAIVAGDGLVEIIGNIIEGPGEVTMNGGIAVANLLGLSGTNKVIIEGNKITKCRYGITLNGVMDARIIGNTLIDNDFESNPMNGGSGISLYNSNGGLKAYVSNNHIEGHLWGITNIGSVEKGAGPDLNLGNNSDAEGIEDNPGGNVFINNGNSGKLYDLYNNSPLTVYAQGNTWGVEEQTEALIEGVIVHKVDDDTLGEVIFMPAAK